MSEHENVFTKENLNTYLKELAKEYRKLNGKSMPADIVLIGGAAILANYGFREMTTDIDAVIGSASSMKEAINRVGDKYNLPSGWLNSDFMRTDSYSPRLIEHSQYYKQFSNVLTIRTVTAEYLIAMKLRSGRKYKNDCRTLWAYLPPTKKREIPSLGSRWTKRYAICMEVGKVSLRIPEYSLKRLSGTEIMFRFTNL